MQSLMNDRADRVSVFRRPLTSSKRYRRIMMMGGRRLERGLDASRSATEDATRDAANGVEQRKAMDWQEQ